MNIPLEVFAYEPTPNEWEVVVSKRFNNKTIAEAVALAINATISEHELTVIDHFIVKPKFRDKPCSKTKGCEMKDGHPGPCEENKD